MTTPGWVYDEVAGAVRGVAASIGHGADALAADADALVRDGARLAGAVVASIRSVGDADRLAALAETAVPPVAVPVATRSRRLQVQALALLDVLVRTAAVAALARRVGADTSITRDAAMAARDHVVDLLDARAATAGDATYAALEGLRVAVVARVQAIAPTLADVERVAPARVTPTLVLSYELYGDADRAVEIAARNRLPRPGLVHGPISIARWPT